ncbi:MAG: YeeE/YedE family protein [Deltaproteobacteria bacterium]
MENFTPVASLVGGILIGLASFGLLAFNGRIAGISGITGALLAPKAGDVGWRLAFFFGLVLGGIVMGALQPQWFTYGLDRSVATVAIAGLVVGFGTRLGSGCTSGHGVCGISRLSVRSIVATVTFMATGAITVFLFRTWGAS